LTIFHPDMIWPWPPDARSHDPAKWVFRAGRYNYERWRANRQELFDTHELVHNRRRLVKIVLTKERDGAFAVVDVDTLWRDRRAGQDFRRQGRACKVYSKVGDEWKMTMHTGLLDYGQP
jgi:ketosteroid isomerase-like protein